MTRIKGQFALLGLVAAYGMYTVVCQIVFMREFFVVAGGNELLIGIFYFSWFLGVMGGAYFSSRSSDKTKRPLQRVVLLLFVQILATPFLILFIRCMRTIFRVAPGEYIPLFSFWLGTLPTLVPFGFITGFNFPLLCRGLEKIKRRGPFSIGGIYTADTVGSVLGGILFSFLVIHFLKPFPAVILLGGALLPLGAMQLEGIKSRITPFRIVVYFLLLFLLGGPFTLGGGMERLTSLLRWNSFAPGFRLVQEQDTPYQHLSIAGREGQYSLFSNGGIISSFPDPHVTSEEVHLIMSVCPNCRRILILGGGNPQILPELLKYPVRRIDYVEVDDQLLPFLKPYLSSQVRAALAHRVRIINEDARTFIRKSAFDINQRRERKYDLIWVDIAEPTTAESNRFYTVDFYSEAALLLSHRGIYVTSCRSAVNYFGETVGDYVQSIYKSLGAVFEEVRVTPGTKMYLFASLERGAISLQPEKLARRFQRSKIRTPWFSPYFFQSLLDPSRVKFTQSSIEKDLENKPRNTDLHPVTYIFNLRLWARQSGSGVTSWLRLVRSLREWHVASLIAILTILGLFHQFIRRKKAVTSGRFTVIYMVAITGACGMAAEIILLYLFQNLYGCVYQKIGLFIASFMGGLGVGGGLSTRYLARGGIDRPRIRMFLIGIEGAFWVFLMALGLLIPSHVPSEPVFYILVLVAGILTGAEFPLAGGAFPGTGKAVGTAAGRIDMADHAGAAIGAVLTGIVLVPSLGIPRTLFILALLKLSSLTLLTREKKKIRSV